MDNNKLSDLQYEKQRKKRVGRIKRMIIIGLLVLILIPIFMCIFLTIRINSLQKQINFLYDAKLSTVYSQKEESNAEGTEAVPEELDGKWQAEGAHKIYLTFDDGPSDYTDKILDILGQHNIKATFFVTGKEGEEYEALYKRIVEDGHTLGMHSYSHKYSSIYSSLDAFKEDYYKISSYLEGITGVKPNIYRFPGGSNNQVANMDIKEAVKFLESQGVEYYDWNASNGDAASKKYSEDELIENVVKSIADDKEESIVLMHDSNTKKSTVDSLAPLLARLQELNVEFLPIDGDTTPIHLIK